MEDAKLFVNSALKEQIEINEEVIITSTISRLAVKLLLFNNRKDVNTPQLKDLLVKAKKIQLGGTPMVQLYTTQGKKNLVIRGPVLDMNDNVTVHNFALLLNLAMLTHGLAKESIAFTADEQLGKDVKLVFPKSLTNLLNGLISSAQTPLGFFAGEDHKFQTGYKANLPGILASMRLLNWKREYLRVRPRLPQGVSPVAFYDLQETFNTLSGLKNEESKGWQVECLKAIFASCIKHTNTGFPGGWIHQNRVKNNAKSDFALIQCLGWTEKICNKSKLLEVLFTTVDEESKVENNKRIVTKRTIVNVTRDKRPFGLPEFRTGVAMLLPRVCTSSDISIKEQIKVDSLSVMTLPTLTSSMDKHMVEAIDILNDAYTLRVSVSNPKSKTKPVHYQAKRGQLLTASARLQYVDAEGHSYKGLFDLPDKILKQFCQIFPYTLKVRREVEESTNQLSNMEVDSNVPAGQSSAGQVINPPKRVRISKGQATEIRRRSGRIARKAAAAQSKTGVASTSVETRGAAARSRVPQSAGGPVNPPRIPPWELVPVTSASEGDSIHVAASGPRQGPETPWA